MEIYHSPALLVPEDKPDTSTDEKQVIQVKQATTSREVYTVRRLSKE